MNNKIKIYAIALASAYLLMLLINILTGFDEDRASFWDGYHSAESEVEEFVCDIDIAPKSGYYTFLNEYDSHGGKVIKYEPLKIRIKSSFSSNEIPISHTFRMIIMIFLAIPFVIILISIPILLYQITKRIITKGALDYWVVQNTILVGWLNIALFVITTIISVLGYLSAQQLIKLTDYEIKFPELDFSFIFLGLLALFLGEVLKVSLSMKEEQNLTI